MQVATCLCFEVLRKLTHFSKIQILNRAHLAFLGSFDLLFLVL